MSGRLLPQVNVILTHGSRMFVWTALPITCCAVLCGPLWGRQPLVAVTTLLLSVSLICTCVILYGQSGHRLTAALVLLGAVFSSMGWVEEWGGGPLPLTATMATPIALVLIVWAMFRVPKPDLIDRRERLFLWTLTICSVGGQAAWVVTCSPRWSLYPAGTWWPAIDSNLDLHVWISQLVTVAQPALVLGFLVLWFRRFRRVYGLDRRMLVPIAVAASAGAIGFVVFRLVWLLDRSVGFPGFVYAVYLVMLAMVPMSLLISALWLRQAKTTTVSSARQMQHCPTLTLGQETSQSITRPRPSRAALEVSNLAAAMLSAAGRAMFADELRDEVYDLADQAASRGVQIACALRQCLSIRPLRAAARAARLGVATKE